MNLQVTPIQQQGSELEHGKRYYHGLSVSYEQYGYYIYDGIINGEHQFVAPGTFNHAMRTILVKPEDLEVKADRRIRIGSFREDAVTNDGDRLALFGKLKRLWEEH